MGEWFDEIWRSRQPSYFLVWRDVKVRYVQAVIREAAGDAAAGCFTFFFGNPARIPTTRVPYALFSYSAFLPGTHLSVTLTQVRTSLGPTLRSTRDSIS